MMGHHLTMRVMDLAWDRLEIHACRLSEVWGSEAQYPTEACTPLDQGRDTVHWGWDLAWDRVDHLDRTWDHLVLWDPHQAMVDHLVHETWVHLEEWVPMVRYPVPMVHPAREVHQDREVHLH